MTETEDPTTTTTPLHLTVDPWWELVEALAFGEVCDLIGAERFVGLVEDRVALVLDREGTSVIGFVIREYADLDIVAHDEEGIWDGHRFAVPALGLTSATVGEILLAVWARFGAEDPSADALHFHRALNLEGEAAVAEFQLAVEAGDMKAHYGLGYTLCELERFHEAYGHLRYYTEVTPGNAWAWCYLGQACVGKGDLDEALAAFERAIEIDPEETDAGERLEELG